MLRLYLVRHGQTAWNATARHQGQTDIPLDDVGRRQSMALRPRLATIPFDAIYSSALHRARETAALLVPDKEQDIIALPELNEISYGAWEGFTREEIAALFPAAWRHYEAAQDEGRPTDGETRSELRTRVVAALRRIESDHPGGGQVLVATHGGTMRMMIAATLGTEVPIYRHLRFDNASLSIVDLPHRAADEQTSAPRGVVTLLNDTAHLGPVPPL